MAHHVLHRGLDIPIAGRATGAPVESSLPSTVGYLPTEFRGMLPKPTVREGDVVRRGSPLFAHKRLPEMQLLSPVSGRVKEIRRGARRVVTDVVVETEGTEADSLRAWDPGALAKIGREDAVAGLLRGGLWPALRTRPLDNVADPAKVPQSILIGAMETGPLQPGLDVLLGAGDREAVQAGVHVLKALTNGPVHLARADGESHPALQGITGVEEHRFRGKHPAGDPGVQVNLVDPPRGGSQVWWIRAWDVALVGRLFLEGAFPAERVYAVVGAGAAQTRFVKTVLGASLAHLVGEVVQEPVRWINGSVLTGVTVGPDRHASYYARGVHVLPENIERELFGWITPQFGRFSVYRAFLAGFAPKAEYDIRPGLWGGHRAMIPFAAYRDVIATPDIEPEHLFKSIIAGDLEDSIQLGLLDLTQEEAALCTYVCPSKIEFDVLLREGLDLYEKES